MHLTCTQQELSHGLSIVSHAVSGRPTLPILANLLLAAEGGRLKLAATNLEIGITCWLEAEILEEGSTTLPAKLLSDLVNSLPQGPVDLQTNEQEETRVRGQRTSATLKGMDPEDFPWMPDVDEGEAPLVLEARQLKELIEQVAFAAADDDSRPILTSVAIEVQPEQVTFASADAFRMAMRTDPLPGGEEERPLLLLPAKTLKELSRILSAEGEVQLFASPKRSQVLFHTEQVDLVSRLLDGIYPNFRAIIPKEVVTRVVLETKAFASAVKSVTPFARESSNITVVKVGEDLLTIEATSEDVGSNVSTLPASIEGPAQDIIFNIKYLAEVLAAIPTEQVALELISKVKPGVFKPVEGPNSTYVIMPMSTTR